MKWNTLENMQRVACQFLWIQIEKLKLHIDFMPGKSCKFNGVCCVSM